MKNFLFNKFDRILQKKATIVLALIVMPLMIVFAIYFSGHSASKELIGYLGADIEHLPTCEQFEVVPISEMPKLSQMVEGTYAAVVSKDDSGNYIVTTLKSETDIEAIETLFTTGRLPDDYKGDDAKREERGVGTNILGFITMLMIVQGVALTSMYPEDRTLGAFRRIMTTDTSLSGYLSAQLIFTLLSLYIPTYLAIVLAKLCLGADLGFSLGKVMILLLILTLFSVAFALFISSVLDRNIGLVTSGVSIITCILAGCFVPLSSENKFLTAVYTVMPQKSYMELVHGIEFGGSFADYKGELFYIFALSLLLLVIGITVIKSRTSKGVY